MYCFGYPSGLSTAKQLNPLESRGNYTAKYEVGTLAVDGWAEGVTFGTAKRGLSGALAHPGPSTLYQM